MTATMKMTKEEKIDYLLRLFTQLSEEGKEKLIAFATEIPQKK